MSDLHFRAGQQLGRPSGELIFKLVGAWGNSQTSICVLITSVPVRALLLCGLHPDSDQRVQPGEEHQVCSLSVRLNTESLGNTLLLIFLKELGIPRC